ncbi:hypothetical protein LTR84_007673 [Exophiala bonariae]|uniref:Ubiquitin-like domain-containing protein n=1 Tax=Exophiala bonariae TaxID=1690606 RepID=A0AAV9NKQ5_9EURO|nr:hypothetical protein LTR84_007673 [Exophiala bonariae]
MSSGVKRSLFSKPAWAATAPGTSTKPASGDSIFGRNAVYEDLLVAEQRKREKKQAKAKERAEKAKDIESRDTKRRRISLDAEDENTVTLDDSDVQSNASSPVGRERESPLVEEERPVTRSTSKSSKNLHMGLDDKTKISPSLWRIVSPRRTPVNLDDDEPADDDLIMLTPPNPKSGPSASTKTKAQLDDDESDEDDEFLQELKRKAREKARRQKLGPADSSPDRTLAPVVKTAGAAALPAASAARLSPTIGLPPSLKQRRSEQDIKSSAAQNDKERVKIDDPEVRIMIISSIPDAQALIVKRKVSQPLKQVREFWCTRNKLDPKVTAKVFFTWRGTRLFDSTTMRGPIQKLKNDQAAKQRDIFENGDMDDDDDDDGDANSEVEDPSHGHIELEAMTPEIFDERQREKERKAQMSDDEDDDYDEREQEAAAREEEEKLKGSIIIRLVSQSFEPMNLRVRPHTSVGKMIQGFAATRQPDEGKSVWLVFDGERLEPEKTVEEIGLEDQDEIEVNVR